MAEQRSMRADARRNQESLLDAARDVFVERGPDVALDEIARRAGVGIATLYRRFPDRAALMTAVVAAALETTCAAAQRAIDESPDPLTALETYMHAAIEARTPAVIPILLDHLQLDHPDIATKRRRAAGLAQRLIDDAHAAGVVRKDIAFGDIGLMLIRIARALPGPMDETTQRALAHRHIDLLLSGLRQTPDPEPLSGPALDLPDLQGMGGQRG